MRATSHGDRGLRRGQGDARRASVAVDIAGIANNTTPRAANVAVATRHAAAAAAAADPFTQPGGAAADEESSKGGADARGAGSVIAARPLAGFRELYTVRGYPPL